MTEMIDGVLHIDGVEEMAALPAEKLAAVWDDTFVGVSMARPGLFCFLSRPAGMPEPTCAAEWPAGSFVVWLTRDDALLFCAYLASPFCPRDDGHLLAEQLRQLVLLSSPAGSA